MKILEASKFISLVHLEPGDNLKVTWHDKGKIVFDKIYKIKEEQFIDTAVRVKLSKEEMASIGLRDSYSLIFGRAI